MTMATTADGRSWQPQFIQAVNAATCIGCGRCYKVCGRNVFELIESEDDSDDWDDDVRMVMSVADAGDCIGCGACERVCPKGCHQS